MNGSDVIGTHILYSREFPQSKNGQYDFSITIKRLLMSKKDFEKNFKEVASRA